MDTTETALLLRVQGFCGVVELHVRLCPGGLDGLDAEMLIMEAILDAQWALILVLWAQEEDAPDEVLDMEPPADEELATRYASQAQMRLSGRGSLCADDPRASISSSRVLGQGPP